MVTDNSTLHDIDKALLAAWASYTSRALKGDDSANRILDYCDSLLEKRRELVLSTFGIVEAR